MSFLDLPFDDAMLLTEMEFGGERLLPLADVAPAPTPRLKSGKGSRGPRPRLFKKGTCQADGCNEDLSSLPFYNQRNHICVTHKKAETFSKLGALVRFCQRCGISHPLPDFDGTKRSCRKQLEKHNSRRRKQQTAATPSASPATSLMQSPRQLQGGEAGYGSNGASASSPATTQQLLPLVPLSPDTLATFCGASSPASSATQGAGALAGRSAAASVSSGVASPSSSAATSPPPLAAALPFGAPTGVMGLPAEAPGGPLLPPAPLLGAAPSALDPLGGIEDEPLDDSWWTELLASAVDGSGGGGGLEKGGSSLQAVEQQLEQASAPTAAPAHERVCGAGHERVCGACCGDCACCGGAAARPRPSGAAGADAAELAAGIAAAAGGAAGEWSAGASAGGPADGVPAGTAAAGPAAAAAAQDGAPGQLVGVLIAAAGELHRGLGGALALLLAVAWLAAAQGQLAGVALMVLGATRGRVSVAAAAAV